MLLSIVHHFPAFHFSAFKKEALRVQKPKASCAMMSHDEPCVIGRGRHCLADETRDRNSGTRPSVFFRLFQGGAWG